jgi:protein gp37
MGSNTKIEWAHHTFNPWWGCVKASDACDHCYAETFARRVGFSETGSQFPIWGKGTQRRVLGQKYWHEPIRINRRAKDSGMRERVFCGSMCDVMEDHPTAQKERLSLYQLIEETPYLDWLLLTKRPQNFRRFLPQDWMAEPRKNVWLMTTVESQAQAWRVVELLRTPAARHGLSCEPLLGPLDLKRIKYFHEGLITESCVNSLTGAVSSLAGPGIVSRLDWVICGGESGQNARPMHPDWARSLRDQCEEAGVSFFFKQWGEWTPGENVNRQTGQVQAATLVDYEWIDSLESLGRHDGHIDDQPDLYRVGKKAAGRILDGREWNEVPR